MYENQSYTCINNEFELTRPYVGAPRINGQLAYGETAQTSYTAHYESWFLLMNFSLPAMLCFYKLAYICINSSIDVDVFCVL
jgi:hypothetical protein